MITTANELTTAQPPQDRAADPAGAHVLARVTRRLIPFIFLLYVLNFLARVNIGYAALDMTKELRFSNEVFGLGAGIFFLGYVLLQLPGAMLIELWSARRWMAVMLVAWGVLASMTGFVQNATQLYVIRFFLGAAEAGFVPGMLVYLTHWYPSRERTRAAALFMAAMPASNIIGAPLAGLLMSTHWLHWAGWRWMLVLEGLPAVAAGVITLWYLTDWPKDAAWLADDERRWLTARLAEERRTVTAGVPHTTAWQVFRNVRVLLLAFIFFFMMTGLYGVAFWLPKFVQKASGYGTVQVTLVTAIPYLAALPAMLFTGWHSDRTGERSVHCAVPLFLVAIGLALSLVAGTRVSIAVAMFAVATAGIYASLAPFWALPTIFLTETAAAAGIAFINSVGNLGGFVGLYLIGVISDRTGTYTAAIMYLVGSATLPGLLLLACRAREAEQHAQV